jgi:hypothetical protein
MGRQGYLWSGFCAFAVLLALSIPDGLYSRPGAVRHIAEFISTRVAAIDQLAAVSDFPGTVRIVMSVLCLCIPPLFLIQWLVPGFVTWRPEEYRPTRLMLTCFIFLVPFMFLWFPFLFTIDAAELQTGPRRTRALNLLVNSRIGLGVGAGIYCVCSTYLLAMVPRAIRALVAPR